MDFSHFSGFIAFMFIFTAGFWLLIFLLTFVVPYWLIGAWIDAYKEKREGKATLDVEEVVEEIEEPTL